VNHRITSQTRSETDDDPELPLDWLADLPLIAEQIESTGAAALILDPLAVVYKGGTDTNNPQHSMAQRAA
jgi:hypothetical protein